MITFLKSYNNILKKQQMHDNSGKFVFSSVDKKKMFPHIEWLLEKVLVCAHLSSKLAHGTLSLYFSHVLDYVG